MTHGFTFFVNFATGVETWSPLNYEPASKLAASTVLSNAPLVMPDSIAAADSENHEKLIQINNLSAVMRKNGASSINQEIFMSARIRKQVVRCQSRNRDVEVSYAVTGKMFTRKYEIVSCPAMHDGSESCNRRCWATIARPPRYLSFATNNA